ncbi:hypothetical protein B0H13DRAFT_1876110 [Mycena leptocephala]|nr:hypothetical protein B0H13DRAFT_1876110 [Mycena leptocephala]
MCSPSGETQCTELVFGANWLPFALVSFSGKSRAEFDRRGSEPSDNEMITQYSRIVTASTTTVVQLRNSPATFGFTLAAPKMMEVQELVDLTIDFLYDSRVDLKRCALVNQSWLPAAQYHLFSYYVLQNEPDCQRLFNILQASSRIRRLITHLALALDPWDDMPMRR